MSSLVNVACRRIILDYHWEVIHLYSLQYWAEDTAMWELELFTQWMASQYEGCV